MASFGMEGKLMAKSRKDQRGRVLRKGESQRSSDGRYVYQYTDGMGKRRSIYARDLMTLREKEKRLARDSMDGLADYVNRRTTLNYVFDRYISTKYDLKEQTKVNYMYTYDHFVRNDIGRLLIKEIRYSDMKRFYLRLLKEKGIKGNTLGNVHCVLHPAFDMAVRDDIIRKNPTDNLMKEFKKMDVFTTGVRHALTSRQQKIFLDYVEADPIFCRWFPILTVLFGTGMRIGECLGLRWEDIDLDKRTIHVNHTLIYREMEDGKCGHSISEPKTKNSNRVIPILNRVAEAFQMEYDYQEEYGFNEDVIDGMEGFVFRNRYGTSFIPQSVNRAIKRICEAYNAQEILDAARERRDPELLPDFFCHHIRHTFCTRLCEAETNLKVIQDIMGHSDIRTTMDIYAEVSEEKKQDVMTALENDSAVFL